MRHEPPKMDDDDECDTTYAESALGASGVTIGADGIARPLPEHDALARAGVGHRTRIPLVLFNPSPAEPGRQVAAHSADRRH